ncbi:MAG TPA: NACHT domain-containing protein, partial [Candidatus Angelobacter sp.]|nr:NACHT domain-containing protein [Candidatus Angelobacter sp.]
MAKEYADSTIAKLYKRLVPNEKLIKATQAFLARFNKELDSASDLPTITMPAYEAALKVFLSDAEVLEALEGPLDGQSHLKVELLNNRWRYLRTAKNEPLIELPGDFDWGKLSKRYGEALQQQALADPELRQLVTATASLRTANATEEAAAGIGRIVGPVKTFDLTRYAQSVIESYCYLKLGSFDADWVVYENRVHLESVYVPQSAKQALPPRDLTRDYLRELQARGVEVREDELRKQTAGYAELKTIPLLEVVETPAYNRLVILGDPGLGKSTLLKYLALRWAQQPSGPLTLLVELRRTIKESGEIDFLDYLERGAGQALPLPKLELNHYLAQHESLVLFDGLDEVVESSRGDVVLKIIGFAREYPRARVIVTTRIHGYHPGSSHPEQFRNSLFQQFTLQDFTPSEIDRFVIIWHQEAFQDVSERSRYELRLRKALEGSPSIRELAANPLLLTMMVILNRVQDLPRDRGRLYERCAELLLKNWDLEKFPELSERKEARDIKDKLGPEEKMRILERVAEVMQEERTGLAGNLIGQDKLKIIIEQQLDQLGVPQSWAVADDLIWMLGERNFMLAHLGDRQFAFVHRTFLEYFCARDLRYRLEKTATLTVDQLASLFRVRWQQDEWQEVICLLCGLIAPERVGVCIEGLLDHEGISKNRTALFFAARCLQ